MGEEVREQGIRWKKTGGYNQYFDDNFERWIAFGSKVLFDVFCALIFVCSARLMLSDVYYWAEFSEANIWDILIIATIISVVMEFAQTRRKLLRCVLQWGVLIVGTLIIIHYITNGEDTNSILSGLRKIVGFYMDDWNTYYETSVVYITGKLIYVTESLDFIMLILFFVLFWMTKMLKQNLVIAIMPGLVIILELLVGHSPEYDGLMLMFIGVLMSNTSKWTSPEFSMAPGRKYISVGSIRFFSWIVIAVVIYVLCGMVKLVGMTKAEELIYYSSDMKKLYNEVIEDISEMSVWDVFNGEGDSSTEEVNNDTPKYTGKEILQLSIWSKPKGNLYLKGYYAGYYENGVWKNRYRDFEKACEQAGFDLEMVSEQISLIGMEKVLDDLGVRKLNESAFGYEATITYLENTGKKAYLPYFFEFGYDEKENGITLEGDGRYRKKSDLNEMSLVVWAYSGKYEDNILTIPEGKNEKWQEWYEKYVLEQYLDVPDNMENIKNIALGIKNWDSYVEEVEILENERRMNYGMKVAEWMQKNTVYTLNPPDLPKGEDPIEYFVGTSKRGYCMHYASAAVMILRELGVPARYASGYIVKNDVYNNQKGSYVATVVDRNAHAWVEIYLNDVGWVPLEVTKGYNEDAMEVTKPTTSVNNATTKPNVTEPTKEKDTTKAPDEIETTSEEETTSKYVGDEGTETSAGGSSLGVGNGKEGSEERLNAVRRIVKIIVVVVLVSMGVFAIKIYKDVYDKRLEREINDNRTLSAIKMINRRVYNKLRRRGKILRLNIRDDEYKKVLIATYPQIEPEEWENYMVIVKAAAFSKRELSKDEMLFCYELYSKIMSE